MNKKTFSFISASIFILIISLLTNCSKNKSDGTALPLTPSPQYIYVSNVNTSGTPDTVSLFQVNSDTGQLTALSTPTVTVGNDPYDMYIPPHGRNLYVANSLSNTVSQFSISASTGLLTPLTPATVAQSTTPYAMVTHPNGNFLYAANGGNTGTPGPGTITQYAVAADGSLTTLTPSTVSPGVTVWFLAMSVNGRFLYVTDYGTFAHSGNDSVLMYSIDQTTGQLSALTPFTIATEDKPWHINVHPNGNFVYVTNNGSNTLSAYALNSSSGQLTQLSPATYAVGNQPIGLAIDPQGRFLYVANSQSNTVSMFRINTSTGALTAIGSGSINVTNGPYGAETDLTGRNLYVAQSSSNTVAMFAIDQSTGALTALSPATVTAGTNPRFIKASRQ